MKRLLLFVVLALAVGTVQAENPLPECYPCLSR